MKRIAFSARMVRAILDGSKRATRRVAIQLPAGTVIDPVKLTVQSPDGRVRSLKPAFAAGDVLGVCESVSRISSGEPDRPDVVRYDADGQTAELVPWRWKVSRLPPRYCPNDLVRIKLRVLEVRVEFLGTMLDEEAVEEGVEDVQAFRTLWNELHGPGSFEEDPVVFVYRFERVAG